MHALIEQRLPAIAELCRHHGVRRLEIFGSGARAVDFDPQRSDFDLLVQFYTRVGAPGLRDFFDLQEELTALLVHDLKNPLAAILANSDFLLGREERPDEREALADVHSSAESMLRMVTNLLDIRRSEEGALALRPDDQ